jgi:hypothetical protein
MRFRLDFRGTLSFGAPPAPAPEPTPAEEARLIFDPLVDRSQAGETADEFRLTYVPPGTGPSIAPAAAKVVAYPAGSVPADATPEALAALPQIASVEVPVGGFGRFYATLAGLAPGQAYDAVILTGFADA